MLMGLLGKHGLQPRSYRPPALLPLYFCPFFSPFWGFLRRTSGSSTSGSGRKNEINSRKFAGTCGFPFVSYDFCRNDFIILHFFLKNLKRNRKIVFFKRTGRTLQRNFNIFFFFFLIRISLNFALNSLVDSFNQNVLCQVMLVFYLFFFFFMKSNFLI